MNIRHCLPIIVLASLAAATVVTSCRNGKTQHTEHRNTVADEPAMENRSLTVLIESINDECMNVKNLATGKQATYSYGPAAAAGYVKGSISVGDTVSIVPNDKGDNINSMINLSELTGQWFYDMEQRRGMKFGRDGALSSINMENVSFRNWKIENGALIIYYVDMQQRADSVKQYWVDHSEIMSLSRDELQMNFRDTVLNCRRQAKPLMLKF